uniref:Insulin-like growth factor-binding protein 2 n=1 Tax=Latimeria chalumnae TaxID=7897 RepID=H3AJ40_LATCH
PLRGELLFRCPPCSPERLAVCPAPRALLCSETVREPGCGCCPVCAQVEGEPCGVYTARCATGLRCYPNPGSDLPLQTLVQGLGTCLKRRDTDYGSHERDTAAENGEDPSEVIIADNRVDSSTPVGDGGRRHPKPGKEIAIYREKISDQSKHLGKGHKHHSDGVKQMRLPHLRSLCQQELDQALGRISIMNLADDRGPLERLYSLHLPNCDKHGQYNLKQCKMSLNGQRGECWCVNPNTGKPIPGAPTVRGDPECHLYYTRQGAEEKIIHPIQKR